MNYYYFKLAYEMGIARFDQWVRKYGFGEPTGIDLLGENPGIVPSPEWKAKHSKEPWYVGETVIAGIGQGYWKVTLLQFARGVAALANNGRAPCDCTWSARAAMATTRRGRRCRNRAPKRISDNPAHLRVVAEGMMQTMQPGGTGAAVGRGAPYTIAGKTGTAQNTSRKGNVSFNPHSLPLSLRHQAWFIAYAPVDNPKIAVAVMVEHGGFGASTAGPIARKIMDAYLLGKMPEPEVNPDVVAAGRHSAASPANAQVPTTMHAPPTARRRTDKAKNGNASAPTRKPQAPAASR